MMCKHNWRETAIKIPNLKNGKYAEDNSNSGGQCSISCLSGKVSNKADMFISSLPCVLSQLGWLLRLMGFLTQSTPWPPLKICLLVLSGSDVYSLLDWAQGPWICLGLTIISSCWLSVQFLWLHKTFIDFIWGSSVGR